MLSSTSNIAVTQTNEQAPTPIRRPKRVASPTFFEGPSARQLFSVLGYCHAFGKMGLVAGGSGVGKTSCARQFARLYPNVYRFEAKTCTRTMFQALRGLARALGIADKSGQAGLDVWEAICARLREQSALTLIIVDEAQNLKLEALEALRSIYDETGVAIVLMGAPDLYPRVMSHGPLSSRVAGARCKVDRHQRRDVESLALAWNVKDTRIVDLLDSIARTAGALRLATEAMSLAASYGSGEVTFADVVKAAKVLGAEVEK